MNWIRSNRTLLSKRSSKHGKNTFMPSFRKAFLGSILAHPLGRREWVYPLFLRPLTILGSSQWWCPSPSRASTSVESTRGWKLKRRRSDNSYLDYPLCHRERSFDNEDYHHRLFLPSSFLCHKENKSSPPYSLHRGKVCSQAHNHADAYPFPRTCFRAQEPDEESIYHLPPATRPHAISQQIQK